MSHRVLSLARNAVVAASVVAGLPDALFADNEERLGVHGLSGISAGTFFEETALQKAMPRRTWSAEQQMTEAGAQDVFISSDGEKGDVVIRGHVHKHVTMIEITDPDIGNWLGPRIGDRFGALQTNLQLGACRPGAEAQAGFVVCEAAETNRILYTFMGRWNGPDGQLPPPEILESWALAILTWRSNDASETGPTHTVTPSFECADASGSIESMICKDPGLAALDRHLHAVFSRAVATIAEEKRNLLRAEQRGWIKARDNCWKSDVPRRCVADVYNDRIAELTTYENRTDLRGTSWKGVRIAGDVIPDGIKVTLTFGRDGRISGQSGCNRFSADVSIKDRTLRMGQIASTRKMCSELEMLAERRFVAALQAASGWAMKKGELVLFGSEAELSFRPAQSQ